MKNTNTPVDMEDRQEDTPEHLRSGPTVYWPSSTVSEALLGVNDNQRSLPNTGILADLATVHDSKNDANNTLIRPDHHDRTAIVMSKKTLKGTKVMQEKIHQAFIV